jgi:hypothetical protein
MEADSDSSQDLCQGMSRVKGGGKNCSESQGAAAPIRVKHHLKRGLKCGSCMVSGKHGYPL